MKKLIVILLAILVLMYAEYRYIMLNLQRIKTYNQWAQGK